MPLVQSVYDLLKGANACDGISLLCCGKILEYEGDAYGKLCYLDFLFFVREEKKFASIDERGRGVEQKNALVGLSAVNLRKKILDGSRNNRQKKQK